MARKKVNRPAKQPADAIESCNDVLRVADERRGILTTSLKQRFGETTPDGGPIDYDAAIDVHVFAIRSRRDVLAEKDGIHRDKEAFLEGLRVVLGKASGEAGQELLSARMAFEGIVGSASTAIVVGFTRQMPETPRETLNHGRHLIQRLRSPDQELAETLAEFQDDATRFANRLEPPITALGSAYGKFRQGQSRFETAVVERTEALDDLREVFVPAAAGIESLFKMAGLDEFAKRVRPSRRRPGLTADRADTSGAAEDASGPTGGSDAPTGGSEDLTGGSEDPTSGSEDPTSGSEDPTSGSEDATGGSEDATGDS